MLPTPLATVGKRCDTMLQVKTMCVALNDFYGALNDEPEVRFEAHAHNRCNTRAGPPGGADMSGIGHD